MVIATLGMLTLAKNSSRRGWKNVPFLLFFADCYFGEFFVLTSVLVCSKVTSFQHVNRTNSESSASDDAESSSSRTSPPSAAITIVHHQALITI